MTPMQFTEYLPLGDLKVMKEVEEFFDQRGGLDPRKFKRCKSQLTPKQSKSRKRAKAAKQSRKINRK